MAWVEHSKSSMINIYMVLKEHWQTFVRRQLSLETKEKYSSLQCHLSFSSFELLVDLTPNVEAEFPLFNQSRLQENL